MATVMPTIIATRCYLIVGVNLLCLQGLIGLPLVTGIIF